MGIKISEIAESGKRENCAWENVFLSRGHASLKNRTEEGIRIAVREILKSMNTLFDDVVKNIENNAKFKRMVERILFHGSDGGIHGDINCDHSNALCDFGRGFYTGTSLEQAENRVSNKQNGVLYAFEYVGKSDSIFQFSDDVLWSLYIAYNRQNRNIDFSRYAEIIRKMNHINSHDIVIGKIADDKISSVYDDFIKGMITDKCLVECLQLVKYGSQVVFKNNNDVKNNLKPIDEYIMTKEMRERSIEWNRKLKGDMDSDIDRIKLQYRRQGRFIDECMEDYND